MSKKNRITLVVATALLAVVVLAGTFVMFTGCSKGNGKEDTSEKTEEAKSSSDEKEEEEETKKDDPTKDYADTVYGSQINPESESFAEGHTFEVTDATVTLPEVQLTTDANGISHKVEDETGILSSNVVLVNLDEGTIVAQRHADEVMVPASMTKVLTLLVATRNLKNLDAKYTLTAQDADYCYSNECSVVGFEVDEQIPTIDLINGTIAVSGADAVLGLCNTVAGSHEAFVEMMNAELEELGLSDTAHFTNAVGLYDDNHRCTALDLAVITKEALYSQICADALRETTIMTTPTEKHPEGMVMYNQFNGRMEGVELPGTFCGAKTGYVDESGNCALSYFISNSGTHYVCVTANTPGKWQCTNDHAAIYNLYTK